MPGMVAKVLVFLSKVYVPNFVKLLLRLGLEFDFTFAMEQQ